MKNLLLLVLLLFPILAICQVNDDDTKLFVLDNLFNKNEVNQYNNRRIFETRVWDKSASIPIDQCYILKFDDGLVALAFDIYLSENALDYKWMLENNIGNMNDLENSDSFTGGDQRLIQVIFYNTQTKKFIGKPPGFPIKGLSWIPQGMGDMMDINRIRSFKKYEIGKNNCILTIDECPDCLGYNYVFKYQNNEILASEKIDGCIHSIYEKNSKLFVRIISNCYDVNYEGEEPVITEQLLFQW